MSDKLNQEAEARELISFQIFYAQRKMRATWGIAAVIAFMFLLEEWFGGSTNTAVLVSMGANVSELVQAGQYWRLMSSVFLHAGFLHVFINTYVLFVLGGFFNRILGDGIYLTIFFVSGITGSLTSIILEQSQVSVGASGAIWGLFGASAVVAFFKTRLIPESVRLRLRRITLINLVINLGVSFLPMVDMWAHFGGGLGGFLVSLSIAFGPSSLRFNRFKGRAFAVLAVLLSLTYASSIVWGIAKSKPWVNQLTTPLQEQTLPGAPFAIAIPKGLAIAPTPKSRPGVATFLFGNLKYDRVAIEIQVYPEKIVKQPLDEAWLARQRENLLSDPDLEAEVKKSIDLRKEPEGSHVFFQQKLGENVAVYNYVLVRNHYLIKLVFLVSAHTKQVAVEALARRVIKSIKMMEE